MSTLRTDTIQNAAGTASVPTNTVVNGSAKAWVNFNGTGTVAIRAAFNVSSITDNGTGDYTVNFTTAMPDANYAVVTGTMYNSSNGDDNQAGGQSLNVLRFSPPTTSNVRLRQKQGNDSNQYDTPGAYVSIFR